jgi:hypothetical protein
MPRGLGPFPDLRSAFDPKLPFRRLWNTRAISEDDATLMDAHRAPRKASCWLAFAGLRPASPVKVKRPNSHSALA